MYRERAKRFVDQDLRNSYTCECYIDKIKMIEIIYTVNTVSRYNRYYF